MDSIATKEIIEFRHFRSLAKSKAKKTKRNGFKEVTLKKWKPGNDNHTKVRSICSDPELKRLTNAHIRRFESVQYELFC